MITCSLQNIMPGAARIHPRPFLWQTAVLSGAIAGLVFAGLPSLKAATAATPKPAAADSVFNGRDFSGWRQPVGDWRVAREVTLDPNDAAKFAIQSGAGVMVNGAKGRTVDLLTEGEYGDVEAHIEFVVPKGSNSGIYLQGRYEIQVYDSWGVQTPKYVDCGGIYERWKDNQGYEGHGPRVNASRPPGEWQSFDIVFRAPRFDAAGKKTENARFIKVAHNGQIIHENVEVTGPTRASRFEDEKPRGPLMLQGDHGPVAYRHLSVRPLE